MFWLGMVVIMILAQSRQGWSEWGFRITVISSLVANLVVGILSGTRRRSAPGLLWGFLGLAAQFFLWGAYQVAEAAATSAIGSLSLCGTDASAEEKQVVAFWAPFLLLHLGGPDNLTAYALEDNMISNRKWIEIVVRILGIGYAISSSTHGGGRSWALLFAASVVMLLAGGVRYVERAKALGNANLDSMQEDASSSSSSSSKEDDKQMDSLKCKIGKMKRQGRSLRDGEALLLAQKLFPVWRHALVDSSVDPASERQQASEMILTSDSDGREWGWESMCKVAEMELSLIYEFLYTKAILAHNWTWRYYLIRLLSPLLTAAAAFLFSSWLLRPDNGRRVVRGSFVGITYALLTIIFLMDVAWLLRALGSTWAYAYAREHAGTRRWWCSLHRVVVRLDPLQLFCRDPVSHRRWSGTIGRYNLLHECSATRGRFRPEWWPVSMAGDDKPKEMRYLCKLPECVKKVLFERVTEILQQAITKGKPKDGHKYSREDIRTRWGHKAFRSADGQVKSRIKTRISKSPPPPDEAADADPDPEATIFGTEFEEDVLLWHIATSMLLLLHIGRKGTRRHTTTTWAIEILSEYMMFLVAVRRQMLPGLVLHSQLQVTRKTLVDDIWARREHLSGQGFTMDNKEKLAMLLRLVRRTPPDDEKQFRVVEISGTEGTRLLADAVDLYFFLSGDDKAAPRPQPVGDDEEMLVFIFNVWVDKLVYAAVRCSREAHARQLSAGGDLTTVLWMLIQHAGPFCIGEAKSIYLAVPKPAEPKEADEKKRMPHDEPRPSGAPFPVPQQDHPAPSPMPRRPSPPPPHPPPVRYPVPLYGHPAPPPPSSWFPWSWLSWLLPSRRRRPPPPPVCPPYSPCPVCPPYSPCPVHPPCCHPLYPPVCPPCYNPSCPPVCPWYPQCPPQHEDAREDEHQDYFFDEDSEE
ncbi:hypothetical protein PVAP13_2KG263100 [Panicum virgatum]|uniref:DUF4220 domain-containing protein n=1 Tax=Panicum virgatum TaxID=38727 RepID=A0A8T0W179_PANVG|nr:hypothetical protein PVAP13_2KG263100 [Panicum virgatum]